MLMIDMTVLLALREKIMSNSNLILNLYLNI